MTIDRHNIFRQLMWDYTITPDEIDAVFLGTTMNAGHYNKQAIFVKLLENLPWFTIVGLFTENELKQLLSDEVINQLRFSSLRKKYSYVQKRLQFIIEDNYFLTTNK